MDEDSRPETTRSFEEISASIDRHVQVMTEMLEKLLRRIPDPRENGD